MTEKPSIYLETSVVSFLTNRLSSDLVVAGHQRSTRVWWEEYRQNYGLYVSPIVLREAGQGDAEASKRRLDAIRGIPSLELTEAVFELAAQFLNQGILPEKAKEDALHLAISTVHGIRFLLSWNYRHIANPLTREALTRMSVERSFIPPTICNPHDLLEAGQ